MLDIKFIRENPDLVKENIKKKFQDHKLELVDKVLDLDEKRRNLQLQIDTLRMNRKKLSDTIGGYMREKKIEEAEKVKSEVASINAEISSLEEEENKVASELREIMLRIPNMIHDSVPIGKSDAENVELKRISIILL